MTELFTGAVPGRIVWGHPCEAQVKTDQTTNQPVLRDGKQVQQWAFGVAFDKAVFASVIQPAMLAEASSGYPQGFPPNFAWKIKDGDTAMDSKGVPYNTMPGRAGCIILTISTEAFAPPVFKSNGAGGWAQMQPNEIKCGDYVALVLDFVLNKPKQATHTPGLYVNPKAVIFAGYGEEIKSAGSFNPANIPVTAFQLPAGASATPMTPTGVGLPGMSPAAAPQMQMQPAMQQPQMQMQPGNATMAMPTVAAPAAMQPQMNPAMGTMPGIGASPSNVAPAPDFVMGAMPGVAGFPGMQ